MIELLIALMLKLEPYEPRAQLMPVAQAIVAATLDREERAVLVVVSMYETTFGRRRSTPFGMSCCWRNLRVRDPVHAAKRFLEIWRFARDRTQCGARASVLRRFGYFHSGRCDLMARNHQTNQIERDEYVRREWRTFRRVLRMMPP